MPKIFFGKQDAEVRIFYHISTLQFGTACRLILYRKEIIYNSKKIITIRIRYDID